MYDKIKNKPWKGDIIVWVVTSFADFALCLNFLMLTDSVSSDLIDFMMDYDFFVWIRILRILGFAGFQIELSPLGGGLRGWKSSNLFFFVWTVIFLIYLKDMGEQGGKSKERWAKALDLLVRDSLATHRIWSISTALTYGPIFDLGEVKYW